MPFFAVFDKATGELYSTGTDVAPDDVLAAHGREAIRITGGNAPPADKDWNPQTRAFDKPRATPPAQQTAEQRLEADPDFTAMTPAEKRLAKALVRALSGGR